MHLHSATWNCQRCGSRGKGLNAQGIAAQHEKRTGHVVEVTCVYRSGETRQTKPQGLVLPLDNPERPQR